MQANDTSDAHSGRTDRRPRPSRQWMIHLAPSMVVLLVLAGIVGFSPDLRARLFGTDQAGEAARKMREIQSTVERHYYRTDWKASELYDAALQGMVEQLNDRYTDYFDEKEYDEFNRGTFGHFPGIGITLRDHESGYPRIVTPYPDTPAWNAGLRPGDEFRLIEGKDPSTINDPERSRAQIFTEIIVGEWLRGEAGTAVNLRIRDRDGKDRDVTITRGDVKVPSVNRPHMLDDPRVAGQGVGYVRLLGFKQDTAKDFFDAVQTLRGQGLKKLIVDIRLNPGGLLREVCALVGQFIERDRLVVRTDGVDGAKYYANADNAGALKDLQLVVLVNRNSASASEILSGALQDYQRAVIVGEVTWGKGLVQDIFALGPDRKTAVKVTISRYFTPSGRVIQRDDSVSVCPTCGTYYRATDSRRYCERDGTALTTNENGAWRGGIIPDIRIDLTDDEYDGLRREYNRMEIYDDRPLRPGDPQPETYLDRHMEAAIQLLSGHAPGQAAPGVKWPEHP